MKFKKGIESIEHWVLSHDYSFTKVFCGPRFSVPIPNGSKRVFVVAYWNRLKPPKGVVLYNITSNLYDKEDKNISHDRLMLLCRKDPERTLPYHKVRMP